jgi:multicomponent Na+:H+ antiporter subunit F
MIEFLNWTAMFICFLMLLALLRIFAGPTIIDRIMGANVIGTKTTVLLVIIGVIYGRVEMFIDIALAYAMLNFIVTIGASRYFMHHKNVRAGDYGLLHRKSARGGGQP